MTKKFINVDGIRIAYIEINGGPDRETIFFVHGNSVSSQTWRKQLNDPLLGKYRLISIDLPAHGDSGPAADPEHAYALPKLGEIMAKALRQLLNQRAYLIAGVSLSTNIVAEMLAFDVRPEGIVLAGPSIIGEGIAVADIIKAGTHVHVVFTDEPVAADVASYAAETSLSTDPEDLALFLNDFRLVKKPFRSTLAQTIGSGQYSDEVAILNQRKIPALVVFGEDEKIIENTYLNNITLPLWGNKIVKIPGASHLVHIDQPAAFNEAINNFADDCFK